MDSWEIDQNCCRVCLEHGALVDWNEEIIDSSGTTYKYCYFKYTQLDENGDTFSHLLCETCSYDLKSFHLLIEKALESYNILQQTFATFTQQTEVDVKFEIEQIEDVGEFETVHLENSTEFSEDNYKKELLELSEVDETLEICKDIKKKRVNPKRKSKVEFGETSKKNSIDLRRQRNNRKSSGRKLKLEKDVEEINGAIPDPDIPNPHIPESKPLEDKPSKPRMKKIMCSYCPKMLNADYVKNHELIHEGRRERKYTCAKCGTKFMTSKSLGNHMLIHRENRDRKYKCEFCDKSYLTSSACSNHRRKHLGQTVSCPICLKEFTRQCDLNTHNANNHSTAPLSTAQKKPKYYIECKECGKSVRTIRWKHHQLLHSNDFQMKCTICDKHFASKVSCHKHVRRLHQYKGDLAKVIDYYGEGIFKRSSFLKLQQTEVVKPIIENSETQLEQTTNMGQQDDEFFDPNTLY